MRFKSNPNEVEAHKIISVLPKDSEGVTSVFAEDIGKVDLSSKESGKYDAGIGDYIVVEGGEKTLLPAHVFNEKYSAIDAAPVDEDAKRAEVQKKQQNDTGDQKEGDVHTFLDEKNKASV